MKSSLKDLSREIIKLLYLITRAELPSEKAAVKACALGLGKIIDELFPVPDLKEKKKRALMRGRAYFEREILQERQEL